MHGICPSSNTLVCDYVPMCYSYLLTLRGSLPRYDKAFTEANDKGDNEGMLKAFIACASGMHQVLLPSPDSQGPEITTPLNPADLGCTCKGFRKIGLCSHVITITAEFIVRGSLFAVGCIPCRWMNGSW